MYLSCYTSYIHVLLNWIPSIASIPHHHTLVFHLNYFPPFHCQHAQLTFHVLCKYLYNLIFFLPNPLAPNECQYLGGGGYFPVTLTYADTIPLQFSSPCFSHNIWSILHHPSNNIPNDTHLYPPSKPPQSQHEVKRDLEAAWRSDYPVHAQAST